MKNKKVIEELMLLCTTKCEDCFAQRTCIRVCGNKNPHDFYAREVKYNGER